MTDVKLWKGGLPYGPQVKRLEDKYPAPDEEATILHEELETIIGETRGTQRYYGIVNSWRKKLFNELGIDSAWVPGDGVKILTPDEHLHHGEKDTSSGRRKTKRGMKRTAATPRDRLNEIGKQRYDNDMIANAKLAAAMQEHNKLTAIELAPVKSLPRPKLVEKKQDETTPR